MHGCADNQSAETEMVRRGCASPDQGRPGGGIFVASEIPSIVQPSDFSFSKEYAITKLLQLNMMSLASIIPHLDVSQLPSSGL